MKRSLALLSAGALALALSMGASAVPRIDRDEVIAGDAYPKSLREFGFFRVPGEQVPDDDVIPYELNTPLWSDGAEKLRFIYVPDGAVIENNGDGLLQFPVGTALIKTFAFGEGDDRRLIETRVLLHRADGWLALPYRWNEEQDDAFLALAGGRLDVTTPAGEDISYRIPNKNQCKACHSLDDVVVPIGPKARNMSPASLERLVDSVALKTHPSVEHRLPEWGDDDAPTAELARAYLDVNCAHCHQPGGGASNSGLDLRWEQSDSYAIGVRKPPVAAGRGAGGMLVSIEPGEPDSSILLHRMESNEPGVAMPELGRSSVDHRAVAIMRKWIGEMDK